MNDRFKHDFKLFKQDFLILPTYQHLIEDFKVVAALIICFHALLTDRSDAQMIINHAFHQLQKPNRLVQVFFYLLKVLILLDSYRLDKVVFLIINFTKIVSFK